MATFTAPLAVQWPATSTISRRSSGRLLGGEHAEPAAGRDGRIQLAAVERYRVGDHKQDGHIGQRIAATWKARQTDICVGTRQGQERRCGAEQ